MTAQGKGFGFLFEMVCGKTLTAISVAGAGFQMGKVRKVLIVSPASVCAVWTKEFQEYASFRYTIRTLLGDKSRRIKELDDLERFPFPALKVAVINYESTWREGIFDRLMAYDAGLIIGPDKAPAPAAVYRGVPGGGRRGPAAGGGSASRRWGRAAALCVSWKEKFPGRLP